MREYWYLSCLADFFKAITIDLNLSADFLKTTTVELNETMAGLCLDDFALEDLSESEIDALSLMREEEFLAHDIYVQLFELYDYRIFEQIAKSEAKHTEAIKTLIDRYGLVDPALNHEVGVFNNPELQLLHNELLAKGQVSGLEALVVGAIIEDVDIFDLQNLLANEVDNEDISFVFNKLLDGSEQHLRAFVRLRPDKIIHIALNILVPKNLKQS